MSFGQWASDYLGVPLEERFNFNPLTYFLYSGIDGAWFDTEDLSTMYQDSAGTTPVTALEQPVGRWVDKSGKGNHATQSITASRPTLSARYNLLTKTENFDSVAWSKNNSGTGVIPIVTNNYGVAPDGSTTATRVQLNKGGGTTSSDYSSIFQTAAVISGTNYSGGFWLKTNDETIKTLQLRDDTATTVNKLINASPEWVFITYAGSATSSSSNTMRIWLRGTQGTSDSADILIWHPQLNTGTIPLKYQRVNTATDYDSAGWPRYLRVDGIDDFYNLPFMNLYGNGSCSIVAARDSVSQATDTYIISERSTADTDPKYFPSRQLASGGNMDSYIVSDEGTVRLDTTGSAFSGAKLGAIRSVVDSGNNIKLFKDGVVVSDDNYTRAGTLTLNNTTIGASVSTTTGNYANMRLYGLIITKSALSGTDRRRCEQFLASRLSTLGVTLS